MPPTNKPLSCHAKGVLLPPMLAMSQKHEISFRGPAQQARLPAKPISKLAGVPNDRCVPVGHKPVRKQQNVPFSLAQNSGFEEALLCVHCRLPIGDLGYTENDDEETLVHGECAAQLVLQTVKQEEEARLKKEEELKRMRRKQYGIGWKATQIPTSVKHASVLGCNLEPASMCCLVLQESSQLVSVVPTIDPGTSVNLEYLSLALQVRRREGRDPLFSLDPKDNSLAPSAGHEDRWQVKRFEPKWLAGTSVGEILFQADYHLKELSMGECAQPIVGMKSCADLCVEEGPDKSWCAREWFVINKAEIGLSEDNVLIPFVKMGVEAREQIKSSEGLVDAPITRGDHPLVKYAKTFTHYFDLIAERKSVVYHLRELAKATLIAKSLVEGKVDLDDSWFNLVGAGVADSCSEIPQLWNERHHSHIHVADGKISDADKEYGIKLHGVYGGVDFGLDKISAAPAGGVAMAPGLRATRMPQHARAGSLVIPQLIAGTAGPPQFTGPKGPQGVDLNLDQFDVGEFKKIENQAPVAGWLGKDFIDGAFWSSVKSGPGLPSTNDDELLLKEVFNPYLCDRRDEGDLFIPPSTNFAYVADLRNLVKEEKLMQQKRKECFFSTDFAINEAGSVFPVSWTPSLCVANGADVDMAPWRNMQGHLLHARPECHAEASKLLESSTPVFDKGTEDGVTFRIHHVGNFDIRTTQEPDGQEIIGSVFSIQAPVQDCTVDKGWSTVQNDQIVKAIEYVEHASHDDCPAMLQCHFYCVFETDWGNSIVTEKTMDGTVRWARNPKDLETRNSLAKVIRTMDCHEGRTSLQDIKNYQIEEDRRTGSTASFSECKSYADRAYDLVLPKKAEETTIEHTVNISGDAWKKEWIELTDLELEAAKELGITSARLWKRAYWDSGTKGLELGGARWEKNWAQLTKLEWQAARQLGITDADAWELGMSTVN